MYQRQSPTPPLVGAVLASQGFACVGAIVLGIMLGICVLVVGAPVGTSVIPGGSIVGAGVGAGVVMANAKLLVVALSAGVVMRAFLNSAPVGGARTALLELVTV